MVRIFRRKSRAEKLRDTVEHVWLAGLGALTLTEREGTAFFRSLVKRGEGFERDTQKRLVKIVGAAKKTARKRARKASIAAIDRVEGLAGTLKRRIPR